jgi:hypothetical protein
LGITRGRTARPQIGCSGDALDMPPELLGAINTWADDGDDELLLKQLRAYNRTGSVFARVIKRRPE